MWNDTASQWENADTFFQHALDSENYTKLFGSYDFTPELTGRINDSTVWDKNHALINLPQFISDGQGGTTQLSYRVVETGISWDGGSQITVSVENDSKDSWQYRFTWNGAGTSPFSPKAEAYTSSIFTIQNYLNTTSITARKDWDGDQDNAYGTRRPPDGMTTTGK